jgi:hypothetical protein
MRRQRRSPFLLAKWSALPTRRPSSVLAKQAKRGNVLLPAPTQKGSPKGLPFYVTTGGEPLNPAACRNHKICKYSAAAEKNADFALVNGGVAAKAFFRRVGKADKVEQRPLTRTKRKALKTLAFKAFRYFYILLTNLHTNAIIIITKKHLRGIKNEKERLKGSYI